MLRLGPCGNTIVPNNARNFIPFSVGDLEISLLSGIEAFMSKSDIKISECYVGFFALVGKVFSQPEPLSNIS